MTDQATKSDKQTAAENWETPYEECINKKICPEPIPEELAAPLATLSEITRGDLESAQDAQVISVANRVAKAMAGDPNVNPVPHLTVEDVHVAIEIAKKQKHTEMELMRKEFELIRKKSAWIGKETEKREIEIAKRDAELARQEALSEQLLEAARLHPDPSVYQKMVVSRIKGQIKSAGRQLSRLDAKDAGLIVEMERLMEERRTARTAVAADKARLLAKRESLEAELARMGEAGSQE